MARPLRVGPLGVVRPRVYVTVPVLTMLGHSDEPAELDGYGPIDAETARRLAADAPSFHRILTHPETGAFLSYGRDAYRHTAATRIGFPPTSPAISVSAMADAASPGAPGEPSAATSTTPPIGLSAVRRATGTSLTRVASITG